MVFGFWPLALKVGSLVLVGVISWIVFLHADGRSTKSHELTRTNSLDFKDQRSKIEGRKPKTKDQRPMFLAKVVGTVWSTKKTPDLEGVRFLIVHPYDLDKEPTRN